MTHPKSERCPNVAEEWQWEVQKATCCTHELGDVVTILEDEEPALAARVRSPMTAEEAIELGDELDGFGEKRLNTNCGEPETKEDLRFQNDCDDLCATGEWFRQTGEAGFGVVPSQWRHVTGNSGSQADTA